MEILKDVFDDLDDQFVEAPSVLEDDANLLAVAIERMPAPLPSDHGLWQSDWTSATAREELSNVLDSFETGKVKFLSDDDRLAVLVLRRMQDRGFEDIAHATSSLRDEVRDLEALSREVADLLPIVQTVFPEAETRLGGLLSVSAAAGQLSAIALERLDGFRLLDDASVDSVLVAAAARRVMVGKAKDFHELSGIDLATMSRTAMGGLRRGVATRDEEIAWRAVEHLGGRGDGPELLRSAGEFFAAADSYRDCAETIADAVHVAVLPTYLRFFWILNETAKRLYDETVDASWLLIKAPRGGSDYRALCQAPLSHKSFSLLMDARQHGDEVALEDLRKRAAELETDLDILSDLREDARIDDLLADYATPAIVVAGFEVRDAAALDDLRTHRRWMGSLFALPADDEWVKAVLKTNGRMFELEEMIQVQKTPKANALDGQDEQFAQLEGSMGIYLDVSPTALSMALRDPYALIATTSSPLKETLEDILLIAQEAAKPSPSTITLTVYIQDFLNSLSRASIPPEDANSETAPELHQWCVLQAAQRSGTQELTSAIHAMLVAPGEVEANPVLPREEVLEGFDATMTPAMFSVLIRVWNGIEVEDDVRMSMHHVARLAPELLVFVLGYFRGLTSNIEP